jgi:hypothetical protein
VSLSAASPSLGDFAVIEIYPLNVPAQELPFCLEVCAFFECVPVVCTGNPVRVDDVTESPKLAE